MVQSSGTQRYCSIECRSEGAKGRDADVLNGDLFDGTRHEGANKGSLETRLKRMQGQKHPDKQRLERSRLTAAPKNIRERTNPRPL